MIDFELKLPATKKTKDQIARDWMIDKAKRPSSAGAYDKFKKRILEARKKDEALKPRQETTMERINRIKYEMKETDKRPKHMDNKNIKTWEQSIAEKPKKPEGQFEKIVSNLHKKKEPTSPVEIDFSLPPMHTAGYGLTLKTVHFINC